MGQFPWGVFGTARDLLGAEEVLIGFYTEPDMIRDIMDIYTTRWSSLFEKGARRVPIDHIHDPRYRLRLYHRRAHTHPLARL